MKRLYFPEWVERMLKPVFSSGVIHFGRHWAMMVAGKATAQSFEQSPERLRELLDGVRARYPDVVAIALAGRIPSIAADERDRAAAALSTRRPRHGVRDDGRGA